VVGFSTAAATWAEVREDIRGGCDRRACREPKQRLRSITARDQQQGAADAHVKQPRAACEVRQRLQLVALRVPAAAALARRGHTRLDDHDGAYSDVRLPMLHTHSGSSRRAFFDTSLRTSCGAGRACKDWTPTPTGGPRAQARDDCEVADRIGELRKVAPVDEPAPHCGTARSTSVQSMLRAATHRFFSSLSSPIPSGSDCRGVASARLQNGAAGDGGAPRTQSHRQTYADRSPACKW
jgi:hypothetical protein